MAEEDNAKIGDEVCDRDSNEREREHRESHSREAVESEYRVEAVATKETAFDPGLFCAVCGALFTKKPRD